MKSKKIIAKNDVLNIEITGMNHEGQGVGNVDGFVVFVEGAITGEIASVLIQIVKHNYAAGVALEILKPSLERANPFCPVYKTCGGCQLQHMTYRETLNFKTKLVSDSIQRIGKIENAQINDTIGMSEPFNYRNKAQFPFGIKEGRPVSGLYAGKSHDIVEFMECAIQKELSDKVRRIVDEFIAEYGIKIYNEVKGTGHLRHLLVRVGHKSDQVMVVFVVNGCGFPGMDFLVNTLVAAIPQIKSVHINVNRNKSNIIMGDENILIYGKESIIDYLGGFKFNISPLSFYQVNPVQTELLYEKALEFAGLTGKETVFDLYSGIGTISLFLSKKAKMVYSVEVVKEAVEDANENVEINGVDNVKFILGEAEVLIPKMYKKGIKADVVVVDPPRKGCDEKLLETIVQMKPKRMVYISCNPSTLARDLLFLSKGGFVVTQVQPVDMFPWTKHTETVALLQKI